MSVRAPPPTPFFSNLSHSLLRRVFNTLLLAKKKSLLLLPSTHGERIIIQHLFFFLV